MSSGHGRYFGSPKPDCITRMMSRQTSSPMKSASVSGPDLGLADALATAVAVGGVDALARLESIDGYEALGITFDGSRLLTSGFVLQPVPELR